MSSKHFFVYRSLLYNPDSSHIKICVFTCIGCPISPVLSNPSPCPPLLGQGGDWSGNCLQEHGGRIWQTDQAEDPGRAAGIWEDPHLNSSVLNHITTTAYTIDCELGKPALWPTTCSEDLRGAEKFDQHLNLRVPSSALDIRFVLRIDHAWAVLKKKQWTILQYRCNMIQQNRGNSKSVQGALTLLLHKSRCCRDMRFKLYCNLNPTLLITLLATSQLHPISASDLCFTNDCLTPLRKVGQTRFQQEGWFCPSKGGKGEVQKEGGGPL